MSNPFFAPPSVFGAMLALAARVGNIPVPILASVEDAFAATLPVPPPPWLTAASSTSNLTRHVALLESDAAPDEKRRAIAAMLSWIGDRMECGRITTDVARVMLWRALRHGDGAAVASDLFQAVDFDSATPWVERHAAALVALLASSRRQPEPFFEELFDRLLLRK